MSRLRNYTAIFWTMAALILMVSLAWAGAVSLTKSTADTLYAPKATQIAKDASQDSLIQANRTGIDHETAARQAADTNISTIVHKKLETTGPTAFTVYLDPVNGDDVNDGLTTSTKKKTLQNAVSTYIDGKALTCNVTFSCVTGTSAGVTLANVVSTGNYTISFVGDSSTAHQSGTTTSAGTATTAIASGQADFTNYVALDCFFKPTSGAYAGLYRRITGWNNGTKTFTFEPFPGSIASGVTYTIDVYSPNRDNYIINDGADGVGFYINNSRNVNITGFKVTGTTFFGIQYGSGSTGTVLGCNVTANGLSGAYSVASGGVTYNNSQFNSNTAGLGFGLAVDHCSVANLNQCTFKSNGIGAFINGTYAVMQDCSVPSNSSGGAHTTRLGYSYIYDTVAENNTTYQIQASDMSSVYLSNNCLVDGNSTGTKTGIGINLTLGATLTASDASAGAIKNCVTGAYAELNSGGVTSGITYTNNTSDKTTATGGQLP